MDADARFAETDTPRKRGSGEIAGRPDPKPAPRIEDAAAVRRFRLSGEPCAGCGARPSNVHHVLQRGSPYHGDDVRGNLLLLCGTGCDGCHGGVHGHRTVRAGELWTPLRVRHNVGRHLVARRPDVIRYVVGKLGPVAGCDLLSRRFLVASVEVDAALEAA